jgi:uncharacterized protein (DUF433 family)
MATALDGHIEVDEKGDARIAGTRMKVTDLVLDKLAHGSSPEQMAQQFPPLTLAQIHSALAYYYDHLPELDAQIECDQRMVEGLRARAHPGPSREDLARRLQVPRDEGSAA